MGVVGVVGEVRVMKRGKIALVTLMWDVYNTVTTWVVVAGDAPHVSIASLLSLVIY